MKKSKSGISAILYPLITIVLLMFFISGIFILIGLSKVYGRTEKVHHIEKIEEIKEKLEIYLYNGTITKDGWKNSSNTNILIVNNGDETIIDYFYVFSKNGELLVKGKMNLKIEKGCRENITLNMLGLPNHMNDWKNFEQNVELIAFHTINGNLFISKYEIPSMEEAIHH